MLDHVGQLGDLDRTVVEERFPPGHCSSISNTVPTADSRPFSGLTLCQSLQLLHRACDPASNVRRPPRELGARAAPAINGIFLVGAEEGLALGADLGGGLPLLRLCEHGAELGGAVLDRRGDHPRVPKVRGGCGDNRVVDSWRLRRLGLPHCGLGGCGEGRKRATITKKVARVETIGKARRGRGDYSRKTGSTEAIVVW